MCAVGEESILGVARCTGVRLEGCWAGGKRVGRTGTAGDLGFFLAWHGHIQGNDGFGGRRLTLASEALRT